MKLILFIRFAPELDNNNHVHITFCGSETKHCIFSYLSIMTLEDARSFVLPMEINHAPEQFWADLGCGSGLFAHAVATLLPKRSHMLCMDRLDQNITISQKHITVEFRKADFETFDFEHGSFDGFIMANSLHYVREKTLLLKKLISGLKPRGSILIIEYDHEASNEWVPYPIPFKQLSTLLQKNGLAARKLSERKSAFGPNMYACQAKSIDA